MIIDKNSDSSVDLVDWLRRSSDESDNLARNNMLDSARINDVYKLTGEKNVLDILYDEETGRLTIVYKDGSTVSIYLDPNGGGCDCDLSEYAKLTDLEAEVTELESKIPTSTSSLTNDSDFVNSTQVDDRIKGVVGAAPEALDTLHEISKALGDDPDFAATITNQIADVKKSIPSIEGLASETYVKDQINAIPKTDLTGYAKEEWVKSQGYLTEHQDISNLATKAEVEDVKNSIPSIEGLATEAYVGQAKSDIEKWVAEQGYLTEHQDISHLASKDYVNEQISKIEHPVVDLTEYAKTSEVSEAIAKSETNTKAWVGEQNYLTEHQDISHLATKEDISNAVNYKSFDYNGQTRKTIQLDNYDSISGVSTTGEGHNLVMLSKWDVADFGSKGVHMNLNSSDKVTINDADHVATEEWVEGKNYLTEHQDISHLATKEEIPSLEGYATETWVVDKLAELEAGEDVDHSVLATKDELKAVEAKIPSIEGLATEEWVENKNYLTEHQDISDVVKFNETSDGRKAITLANHDLILGRTTKGNTSSLVMMSKWDVADFGSKEVHANINTASTTDIATDSEGNNIYTDGLTIYNNKFEQVDHVPVVTVNDDFALATLNHVMAIREADSKTNADTYAAKSELNGLATETYVDEKIEAIEHPTVDLSAYATKDELNSKIATLNSNFQWKDTVVTYEDIAKVYPNPQEGFSVYVDDERTTYVYMGGEWVAAASADDSEPIATEELDGLMPAEAMRKLNSLENYDDSSIKGDMTTLEAKLSFIEAKIAELSRTNIEVVAPSTSGTSLSDASKDYTIQGNITAKMTVTNSKSVTISDSVISNDARASIKSTGDVELKNVSTEGTFAKANGNTVLNITEAASVTMKDMTMSSTQYNGIEIGLMGSVLPKSVIIDNCNFGGETSNNVISIHGTADEAIINISNCKFSKSSNPLRLSNRTGAKVTVNITNCSCEEWDARPEWAGFIICQDYTSKSIEETKQANLFGSDKVTINFINFTLPGGKKLTKPEDMSEICGSGNNQILYVYRDAEYAADKANYKFTPYGDAYPQINII